MAQFPAMPLWTDAYLADTTDLSAEEHGVYLLLLMAAWRSPDCRLPNDDIRLSRTARIGIKKWRKMRPVMERFFSVGDSGWTPIPMLLHAGKPSTIRPAIPLSIQRAVRDRDGDICAYCFCTDGPFHLDHIIPWSRGGSHSEENLTVACQKCNLSKSDMTLEEWRNKLG